MKIIPLKYGRTIVFKNGIKIRDLIKRTRMKLVQKIGLITVFIIFSCSNTPVTNQTEFNVKDFGAVGNGIVDDTKAIQSCFNYIQRIGRGTAYFPKGIYKISRTSQRGKAWALRAVNNLKIKGADQDKTILKLAGKQPGFTRILYVEKVTGVTIENITFDGNRKEQINPEDPEEHLGGVFIDTSSKIEIRHSNFLNTGGDGISIRGPKVSSTNVTIDSCYFNGNYRNGITLGSGFVDIKITNNFFDTEIDDSPIDSEPDGGTCRNVLIQNNIIKTPTLLTIGGSAYNNLAENYEVKNNKLYNCSIYVVRAKNVLIEDNELFIEKAIQPAISCLTTNDSIFIRKNKITVKGKDGISLIKTRYSKYAPTNIFIQDNILTLSGKNTKAVYCAGANNITIERNQIKREEGKVGGVYLYSNYPMTNLLVKENNFKDTEYGVMITPLKNNKISTVEIANNNYNTSNKQGKVVLLRNKEQIKSINIEKNSVNKKEVFIKK